MSSKPRRTVVITIPKGWIPVLVGSIMAAVAPWLIIQALVLVAYISQVSNVWLAGTSWNDSALVATSIWGLGYMSPVTLDECAVTLVPLGLTLMYLFVLISALRVWIPSNPVAVWISVPAYTVTVGLLTMVGGDLIDLRVCVCATVIAAVASLVVEATRNRSINAFLQENSLSNKNSDKRGGEVLPQKRAITVKITATQDRLCNWDLALIEHARMKGLGADRRAREIKLPRRVFQVPGWLCDGCAGFVSLLRILSFFIALSLSVTIGANWGRVQEVTQLLNLRVWEYALLVVGELAYIPNAMMWALSWWLGPGFFMGNGALHTIDKAVVLPLPAVPILAAAPHTALPTWLTIVPVIVGLMIGWWLYTGYARFGLKEHVFEAVTWAVLSISAVALFAWSACGGIGPERMSRFGVVPSQVTLMFTALCIAPAVLVFLAMHPRARGLLTGRNHLTIPNKRRVGTPMAGADSTQTEWLNLLDGSIHTGTVPTVVTASIVVTDGAPASASAGAETDAESAAKTISKTTLAGLSAVELIEADPGEARSDTVSNVVINSVESATKKQNVDSKLVAGQVVAPTAVDCEVMVVSQAAADGTTVTSANEAQDNDANEDTQTAVTEVIVAQIPLNDAVTELIEAVDENLEAKRD